MSRISAENGVFDDAVEMFVFNWKQKKPMVLLQLLAFLAQQKKLCMHD